MRLKLYNTMAKDLEILKDVFQSIEAYNSVKNDVLLLNNKNISSHYVVNSSNARISLGKMTGKTSLLIEAITGLEHLLIKYQNLDRSLLRAIQSCISAMAVIYNSSPDQSTIDRANSIISLVEARGVASNSLDIMANVHNNYCVLMIAILSQKYSIDGALVAFHHRRAAVHLASRHCKDYDRAGVFGDAVVMHTLFAQLRLGHGRKFTHLRLAQSLLNKATTYRGRQNFPMDWAYDCGRQATILCQMAEVTGNEQLIYEALNILDADTLSEITPERDAPLWLGLRFNRVKARNVSSSTSSKRSQMSERIYGIFD